MTCEVVIYRLQLIINLPCAARTVNSDNLSVSKWLKPPGAIEAPIVAYLPDCTGMSVIIPIPKGESTLVARKSLRPESGN